MILDCEAAVIPKEAIQLMNRCNSFNVTSAGDFNSCDACKKPMSLSISRRYAHTELSDNDFSNCNQALKPFL